MRNLILQNMCIYYTLNKIFKFNFYGRDSINCDFILLSIFIKMMEKSILTNFYKKKIEI